MARGDRDSLLLPSGQLVRVAVALTVERDTPQLRLSPGFGLLS